MGEEKWLLATCEQCGSPDTRLPQPFTSWGPLMSWVAAHTEGTGHSIRIHMEVRK